MEGEDYLEMKKYLQKIQEENGLTFIYTFAPLNQNEVQFVVDADPEGGAIGEPYEVSGRIQEVFNGEAIAEEEITSDEWGEYLSAYAPIKDATGETAAAIGGDVSAAAITKMQQDLMQKILLIIFGAVIVGTLMALFFARRVAKYAKTRKMKLRCLTILAPWVSLSMMGYLFENGVTRQTQGDAMAKADVSKELYAMASIKVSVFHFLDQYITALVSVSRGSVAPSKPISR